MMSMGNESEVWFNQGISGLLVKKAFKMEF